MVIYINIFVRSKIIISMNRREQSDRIIKHKHLLELIKTSFKNKYL